MPDSEIDKMGYFKEKNVLKVRHLKCRISR